MVVLGQKSLYTGKVGVFGQSGCNRAEVVVFGQSGCIQGKWLCSWKGVVIGQKVFVFEQNVCILVKLLY